MVGSYEGAALQPERVKAVHAGEGARPQDALLRDMELPYCEVFYPLGYAVEIATNETEVLGIAEECFHHARMSRSGPRLRVNIGVIEGGSADCPREPTRREYNHIYSLVADADNQALLDLSTCTSFAWVTQAAVLYRPYLRYNFLEKMVYLLLGSSVVTDLHAACIAKKGKGILLCGGSGAGKSTLAYGCARAGWTYTSDDTSYLINDLIVPRVIGHAHRVRFRPDAKLLFPELAHYEITPRLEGKPSIEAPIAELPVSNIANECEVDSIVYLKRNRSAPATLIRLPEGTATERMCQELYSAGEVRAKHEKILERFLTTPTYELNYWSLGDAVDTLEALT